MSTTLRKTKQRRSLSTTSSELSVPGNASKIRRTTTRRSNSSGNDTHGSKSCPATKSSNVDLTKVETPEQAIEMLFPDFHQSRLLGSGTFGKVYEYVRNGTSSSKNNGNATATGERFAAKFIKKIESTGSGKTAQRRYSQSEDFLRETTMLAKLSKGCGSKVVCYCDGFEIPTHYIIVMELLVGETLQELIDTNIAVQRPDDTPTTTITSPRFAKQVCKRIAQWLGFTGDKGCIAFRDIIEIALKLAKAVEYIHSKNIAHMDIKPANVVLVPLQHTNKGDGISYDVKLVDFGLACLTGSDGMSVNYTKDPTACHPKEFAGTPKYMAPEVHTIYTGTSKSSHRVENQFKADIYSLGVTFYQLMISEPFTALPADWKRKVMMNDNLESEYYGDYVRDLLSDMLSSTSSRRPSAIEVRKRLKTLSNKLNAKTTARSLK